MNDEMMREAFEKWFNEKSFFDHVREYMWKAWQAAWNTRDQASAPKGGEPIAWESTTTAYFKYITQSKYDKISDAAKQWYKPYRCSDCTNAPEGGVVACWRYLNAEGEVVTEWIDGTPPDKHFDICGNEILGGSVEVAYTRSNAKAGDVDETLVESIAAKIFARRADELFEHGWRTACEWAKRPDMIYDIGSPAYERDKNEALSTHDKTKA